MRLPRPRTLRGQMLLIVLAALALAQALSFALILSERRVLAAGLHQAETFRRVSAVIGLLERTGDDLKPRALVSVASADFVPSLGNAAILAGGNINERASTELAALLGLPRSSVRVTSAKLDTKDTVIMARFPAGTPGQILGETTMPLPPMALPTARVLPPPVPITESVMAPTLGDRKIVASVKLRSGQWLNIVATAPATPMVGWPLLIGAIAGAVALAGGTLWATAQITASLRGLALAAAESGLSQALPETGPQEVVTLAQALNRMKQRLHRSFEEQRELLRAVGHDLRTPITSLRIRTEFVADPELQARMLATLDQMERLTTSAIEAARGGSSGEPLEKLDLRALVEAACEDWADTGMPLAYGDMDDAIIEGRPSEIRRALANLVDNAVKFAGHAKVSLRSVGGFATVTVEDHGPGMSEELRSRVLEPFVRGDTARSTQGFGLGLSIARMIVERHNGALNLGPAEPTGTRAEIRLPCFKVPRRTEANMRRSQSSRAPVG